MKLLPNLQGPERTRAQLIGVVLIMGSLGWASVPLYNWFCAVTGFGGTPLRADANDNGILDQTVTIRFDANTAPGMAWTFTPVERTMEVRIGETGLAFYEAHNPTDRPIAGQASYNIAPFAADGFFTKIDCFCFQYQELQPGETVMMPVSFFVDPEIVEDREGQFVHTITLSYTFYEQDIIPDTSAAADVPAVSPLADPAPVASNSN